MCECQKQWLSPEQKEATAGSNTKKENRRALPRLLRQPTIPPRSSHKRERARIFHEGKTGSASRGAHSAHPATRKSGRQFKRRAAVRRFHIATCTEKVTGSPSSSFPIPGPLPSQLLRCSRCARSHHSRTTVCTYIHARESESSSGWLFRNRKTDAKEEDASGDEGVANSQR
ncbi:hypothetical protein MRX96_054966 [Rhipicephalus microplus]